LGDGNTTSSSTPVTVSMPNGVSFADVAGGAAHVVAIDQAGNAWTWGKVVSGRCGISAAAQPAPAAVSMPTGVSFRAAADGVGFSFALDDSGIGWGWGENCGGVLANGEDDQKSVVPNAISL